MASGDYISFLDHDDTLAPHALASVCETLNRCPGADLFYSDEDKIDQYGKRFEPFFKPDWSPDLLLSENYISHLLVVRSDLLQKVGPFCPECDGSQDYDLILRATEHASRIEHIPRVLYHWRAGEGSTASALEYKDYALSAARRALERHGDRMGKHIGVEPGRITGRWRVRYPIPKGTRVSIIIAAGGKAAVLRDNLDSLFQKTTYRDYEVVVIDNSKHSAIEKVMGEFNRAPYQLRYIDQRNQPFNYSALNNAAARQCDSPLLLFLNDDTSVIEPDWLESMVELIVRPEVGAVGAKLLYPDKRIQHAGVVMGIYDNCGHAFKGLDSDAHHYFDFPDVIRNVSAVTGACLMTKSNAFWDAGGFDETEFAVAFNDIDLCLKIRSLGYRILYTPHALLYHHEAFSKTSKHLVPHPEEVAAMRSKWGSIIANDPYYSPNLTRNDEDYSLRTKSS
jgi:GT2 family glycosyltransferase